MNPAVRMAGFTLLPVMMTMTLIAAIAFMLNRDNGMNAGMVAGQSDADRARYIAEAGLQIVNALSQAKNCAGYTDLGATTFGTGSFTATVNPKSGTPVTLTATATTAEGASSTLTRANVAVYPTTPTTATLQAPDSATGTDTSLNVGSVTANYGNLVSIKVQGGAYRGLIKFDLSTIPAGANITGAMLQLSKTNTWTSPGTITVHRVTTPWVEGTKTGSTIPDGATYSTSDGTTPWTTVGGDYDPAAASLTNIGAGWSSWDVTSLVQGWRAAPLTNYGMILVPTVDVASTVAFDSSDASSVSNHPKLVVTYTAACGAPPPPPPPPPPPGTTVTLPATADTWINENSATTNYGTGISFKVTNAAKAGRGLVKFDLSSIPAGTVLQSAKLQLYVDSFTNPLNSILTVKPVLAPWTENGATWKTANGNSNSWLCGCWGGYLGAAAATASISSTFTPGWVEWDITALAQQWVDGVSPNYGAGVVIDTTSAITFQSRETTANPPQLVITY